ncbi:cyclophilin-like fold protein [Brachyspira innocens]|uniref:Cyclophilin-like fold protein n=1 Tax=Brachyspira innocens TaxID=13264 RepID=A0ABT8YY74_9SPIR|nr:cyclophilin-like fold protein [Brachyspira innocens]MDO6992611.1 cyclophilin-like fold protein [Brachyspira innocens]MDO7020828.1 cyclophilin-like fold protein [Brachyspira innocens]
MENLNTLNTSVNVKIKDKEYKLKLYDNQTAKDFLTLLPLTVNMNDLNRNEKYYNLSKNLTTKTENIGSIKTGDFLLYGNNCIVLFYESFRTSYSYTRLGYIENTEGLKEALGRGNIEITFTVN